MNAPIKMGFGARGSNRRSTKTNRQNTRLQSRLQSDGSAQAELVGAGLQGSLFPGFDKLSPSGRNGESITLQSILNLPI